MANDRRRDDGEQELPKCLRCGGTGWLAYRIVEIDNRSTAILQACECHYGRAMVKAERERDERFKQYSGATRQGVPAA